MKPTDVLKHEHKIVLAVLDGAEREAQNIQNTGKVDTDKVAKIVDFLRTFVDECHHSKEERRLFPKLQEHGMSGEVGPIVVMLREHNEGRRRVAAIADTLQSVEKGGPEAARALALQLREYSELLRDHIDKEDSVLFNMADMVLTAIDEEQLVAAFDAIEAEEIGEGVHEQYHQFAHELMKQSI